MNQSDICDDQSVIDSLSAQGRKATALAKKERVIQSEMKSESFLEMAAPIVAADPSRADEFIQQAFAQELPDAPHIAKALAVIAGR